jgi:hypothetical protein
MVAQWFKYMFCRGKAVLLNGVTTHHERGNYIDGFQRASRPDWERVERVKYDTTFLIGTTGILRMMPPRPRKDSLVKLSPY